MTNPTRSASRFHTSVTRRVLGALAGLALAGGLAAGPAVAAGAATSRTTASARTAAVTAIDLVATLDERQSAALADGIPNLPGTGLRLGDLTADQRAAAYALLRSLLSADAWAQVADLLAADEELDAAAGGGSTWSSDDYHLALFGDPAGDYVLQFSTAELVLSAISQGGEIDVRPDVVA
ncbi:DUF3500 domain-containing protein [Pseudolysinimonas sp.]|jgi:hypothetical protein|uniref:DUF3500 domain-containing protein n=1 Tax=Pseudolysinimonas sp. TaxID=2680009 RepID=UPI003783C490